MSRARTPVQLDAKRAMRTLLVCIALLTAAGWIMLLDTGLINKGFADPENFSSLILRRGISMFAGIVILAVIWILPPKFIRKFSVPAIFLALFLLALVWTPLGITERDCTRWIALGPFTFQPLEFARIALVWFLASWLAATGLKSNIPQKNIIFPGILIGLMALMVALQPNLSGVFFLIFLTFIMAILGGVNRRLIFSLTLLGTAAGFILLSLFENRHARFIPMLRPLSDLDGKGYQVALSLWAITNGGLTGRGPGASLAMYSLPDHSTDFIFAIVCEEWGFLGGLTVILLFGLLVYAGFRIAMGQSDPFRMLLGFGITSVIGLQTVINLGVVLAILPTTGVPLPFLSVGGSNLILSFAAVGLLLNLGRTVGVPMESEKSTVPEKPKIEPVRRIVIPENKRKRVRPRSRDEWARTSTYTLKRRMVR